MIKFGQGIGVWQGRRRGSCAHVVQVYLFLDLKAILVDGWACTGSGNLNHFSLRFCQEHNLATSDPAFSTQLKHDLFGEDFACSYELTKLITVGWSDSLADLMLEGF